MVLLVSPMARPAAASLPLTVEPESNRLFQIVGNQIIAAAEVWLPPFDIDRSIGITHGAAFVTYGNLTEALPHRGGEENITQLFYACARRTHALFRAVPAIYRRIICPLKGLPGAL